jgi:hypothetical protein
VFANSTLATLNSRITLNQLSTVQFSEDFNSKGLVTRQKTNPVRFPAFKQA